MVKKTGRVMLFGLILVGVSACGRGEAPTRETNTNPQQANANPQETTAKAVVETEIPSELAERMAKEAEVVARLDGTEWAIELTPRTGEPPTSPLRDVLRFQGRTVTSEEMSSDGYPTTNVTVKVGDDGIPVWETMQTSPDRGVAFWRGELHGAMMRGVLSKRPLEGATEDYSFVGTPMEPEPEPQIPEGEAPVEEGT